MPYCSECDVGEPAPTLPDELIEEIFLRLPMLGFFHFSCSDSGSHFVPTAKFVPSVEDWREDYHAWDCRHGRVLLCSKYMPPFLLVAWDPMTGRRQRELHAPGGGDYDSFVAAVLCSVAGCNHRACHEGPSSVVFLGLENGDDASVAYAHVSLPEADGEWSKPCFALDLAAKDAYIVDKQPVFIQDTLYFLVTYGFDDNDNTHEIFVLKYDLGSHCLTMIDPPPLETDPAGDAILMAMEDGNLGFVCLDGLTLHLWSTQMESDGVSTWTQRRVMDLNNLLPIQNLKKTVGLTGSVEGKDIIFVSTDLGICEISLKSLEWKKIWKRDTFLTLIPYMSFYKQREQPCVMRHIDNS